MNELALFAGAGGGILGGKLLGWTTVCAVEIERYPRECLLQRQRDGVLPGFPIWDDVRSFDGKPWRGLVDVISGGFPCQDISSAGKGSGIDGERSGLWAEMYRIICEVRPRFVLVENSPMLTLRGLHRVLGDLAEGGYDAAWSVLGAADVGALHRRDRMWIVAVDREQASDADSYGVQCSELGREYNRTEELAGRGSDGMDAGHGMENAPSERLEEPREVPGADNEEIEGRTAAGAGGAGSDAPHTHLPGCQEQRSAESDGEEYETAECGGWWGSEPAVGRVADGVAHRVDRLKAIGNGQVPLVAAVAFLGLLGRLRGANDE